MESGGLRQRGAGEVAAAAVVLLVSFCRVDIT